MTNSSLAFSYFKKALDRQEILQILHNKGAYSDVIREAQEIVELIIISIKDGEIVHSLNGKFPHF